MTGLPIDDVGIVMRFGPSIRRSFRAMRDAAGFLLWELVASFVSLVVLLALVVVFALMFVGVGWLLVPAALAALRRWTRVERIRVGDFTGVDIVPDPPPPASGLRQQVMVLRSPTTRRELTWLLVHATAGLVTGVLAAILPLESVTGVASITYWWALPADAPVGPIYPITSWLGAAGMVPISLIFAGLTLWLLPLFARWRVTWVMSLLTDAGSANLVARVDELTRSRASALEAHGLELRRIERNLHDGAQNRLVGVIMHLGIAERALERDPAVASTLLRHTQSVAEEALVELRETVRGIYPPVLSEHGLGGAIAYVAARSEPPATVTTDGLMRAPAAVEAAAYFAVAEALTNVQRHSGATHVEVVATSTDDTLVVEVRDDGRGGADEHTGTGLAGIRRRVHAFEGSLDVDSPPGGPTIVRIELPCRF